MYLYTLKVPFITVLALVLSAAVSVSAAEGVDWDDGPETYFHSCAGIRTGIFLGESVTEDLHILACDEDHHNGSDDGLLNPIVFKTGHSIQLFVKIPTTAHDHLFNLLIDVAEDGIYDDSEWLIRNVPVNDLSFVSEDVASIRLNLPFMNEGHYWLRMAVGTKFTFPGAGEIAQIDAGEWEDWNLDVRTFSLDLATLTVVKTVINDNGGTASVGSFDLFVGDLQVESGVQLTLAPGTYQVSESGPNGYAAAFGGACDSNGRISLGIGQSLICTITNDDIPPSLTLSKEIVGGGSAELFTLTASGPTSISGAGGASSGAGFYAGTYVLSESGPSGYVEGSWVCEGNATSMGTSSVTLGLGEYAICTITNNKQPTLTLVKTVVGGGSADLFSPYIDGSVSGGLIHIDASWGTYTLLPGNWGVSESSVPGYVAGDWGSDCAADGSVMLDWGQVKTCTITNYKKPTLTLIKEVIGGGSPSLFTPYIDGIPVTWGEAYELDPGSHTVSESSLYAYAMQWWQGDCHGPWNGGSVALDWGDEKVCTITNSKLATLSLVKTVVGGGNPELFEPFLSGTETVFDPVTWGGTIRLYPGIYTASESAVPGYVAGDWGGDCAADGTITLDWGDVKTCTITNYKNPTLTLVKQVEGGGPAAPGDWTLTASGFSGMPGTYPLSESGPDGYTLTSLTCSNSTGQVSSVTLSWGEDVTCTFVNKYNPPTLTLVKTVVGGGTQDIFQARINGSDANWGSNTLSNPGTYTASEAFNVIGVYYHASDWGGDCAADGTVTLDWGDSKTCTITNSKLATLTLTKTVVGGGTSEMFDVFVNSESAYWGTIWGVYPDTYSITESSVPGYTAGDWGGDCNAGGSVSLSWGENKTCTITNYKNPTLTLAKQVEGGDATPADFQAYINGEPVSWGTHTLTPGTYTASEDSLPWYTAGAWGGDCDADGNVSLAWGDNKTCSITNSVIPPTLTLVKILITSIPGDTTADFQAYISGIPVPWGAAQTLSAGDYTASEEATGVDPNDYIAGAWGGDCAADGSVSLALGQRKTCTITNTWDCNQACTSGHVPQTLCHLEGNDRRTIETPDCNAYCAHIKHGDTPGACSEAVSSVIPTSPQAPPAFPLAAPWVWTMMLLLASMLGLGLFNKTLLGRRKYNTAQ